MPFVLPTFGCPSMALEVTMAPFELSFSESPPANRRFPDLQEYCRLFVKRDDGAHSDGVLQL